ncbi:hypothetical protein K439DRAFT_1391153 [Ramaria rubella]|nr:hypothetical protein K439DRAFT_1391153 [Ramaria rubella]
MLLAALRSHLHLSHINGAARRLSVAVTPKSIPPPRGSIQSPKDFLTAIGRSCDTKLKLESWDELWQMKGPEMKQAGVGVQDRRYILWSLDKFRQGKEPSDFAHPEQPKKKIRGWGPSVQFGKRIRSRRHR